MSWLFGKKKHKESPPDTPEEEPAPQDDGYIFVEKRNEPKSDDSPSSLYPDLNNISSYPSYPVKQSSQDALTNDLTNIPFKLCRDLERTMNDDLTIDKLRLEEIASFINRVNADDYDYKFHLEHSVINELNSQNEE